MGTCTFYNKTSTLNKVLFFSFTYLLKKFSSWNKQKYRRDRYKLQSELSEYNIYFLFIHASLNNLAGDAAVEFKEAT